MQDQRTSQAESPRAEMGVEEEENRFRKEVEARGNAGERTSTQMRKVRGGGCRSPSSGATKDARGRALLLQVGQRRSNTRREAPQ